MNGRCSGQFAGLEDPGRCRRVALRLSPGRADPRVCGPGQSPDCLFMKTGRFS